MTVDSTVYAFCEVCDELRIHYIDETDLECLACGHRIAIIGQETGEVVL